VMFAANLMFTVDGPRPGEPATEEVAAIGDEALQIRVSALLLMVVALPTFLFIVLMAMLMGRAGSTTLTESIDR
jgi:hypothetical protein